MPLGPYMLSSAVVLIGDVLDKPSRHWRRGPVGTGFLVRVPSETLQDTFYGYLLTAWHVVEPQSNIELDLPMVTGEHYYPRADAPSFDHPVERLDLAIAPFIPPEGTVVTALQLGHNLVEGLPRGVLLAAPFHYVGYLEPLELVMARSGTIGRVSEYMRDGEYEYHTHLGDVRSYDGFSGSPCFVEYAVPTLAPEEPPVPMPADEPVGRIKYLHLMCGMFAGHLEKTLPGGDVSRHGVGYILSSEEIWGALMSDDLRKERQEKDEQSTPEDLRSRTSVSDSAQSEEFDNFETLTRQLVNTPKSNRP
jgi:hypothetical protein